MKPGEPDSGAASIRLDLIQTRWSLIRQAHTLSGGTPDHARNALVMRYGSSVRRYVGALLRDDHDADEVAQDVIVRMLRGDFGKADPTRGRFRDLLKTAIRNMVKNHWEKQNRRRPVEHELDLLAGNTEQPDERWDDAWRTNVLDLAWGALQSYEESHAGSIAYTLLRLRADHPDDNSEQLAERLTKATARVVKPEAVRQQLRRSRVRFAELLVVEVANGLESAEPDRVQQELIALGLYETVREFLPPEWNTKT